MNDDAVVVLDRTMCVYTPSYCEENIWKLCEHLKETNPQMLENCFCVFISNATKQIPLWQQRLNDDSDHPVVWDYHVILVHIGDGEANVYDLDTTLPFPCDFKTYCSEAVRNDDSLKQCYKRKFRVIPGEEYLRTFASDRSHMRRSDGTWLSPPPRYACIQCSVSTNNIDEFISMDAAQRFGTVMDCKDFIMFFTRR